jgi:cell division protein FtsQ
VVKPSSSLDPRIRARRIAARRAEGRRRLKWAGLVVGVIVVLVGAIAVFASSMFDATDIRVQGAVYTDAAMLDQVLASIKGTPVLLVDTAAAERALAAIPWVESARVSTSFPHTVTVDIRERHPVATFRGGDGKWRVIDGEGRVVAVLAGQPVAYMLITGQNPDTPAGDYAGTPYATAAQLVTVLPPEVRSRTTSVGLDSSTGNLALILDRGDRHSVLVRLGDGAAMADKLARLLNQIHTGLDKVVAIDVSTEEVGVVRG